MRHRHAVSCYARRKYAVKHVNAVHDAFEEIIGRADAHQIAWLVFGQKMHGESEHLVHEFLRLADAQTSDGIAGKIKLCEIGHALFAQILIHAALHDAEEPLTLARHRILAALGPARRALRRSLRIFVVGGIRHALVERHDDVRAERHLHLHRNFGRKEFLRAVDMRAEGHAVFGDLSQVAETEYLETAAVRQDCAVPVHEAMKSARLSHELHARAQKKVIRIG